MVSLRNAILSNPVLAETVKQNHEARERARAEAREAARQLQLDRANPQRVINRARYQRDAAIAALVKARRSKKKSRPLFERALAAVEALRATLGAKKAA